MKKQIVVLFSAAAILASCGSGGEKKVSTGTESGAMEITITAKGNTMDDMSYDQKEIKVKAGSKVKVNLVNAATDAAMQHNIVFVKQGTNQDVAMEGLNFATANYFNAANPNVIAGSPVATPGKTVTVEFTAPAAGTYAYVCTFPGHFMKMNGVLIVE
ncbi:MAG: plastocyanin/azurin family copper-binding protein [Bacteroidia bacterium]